MRNTLVLAIAAVAAVLVALVTFAALSPAVSRLADPSTWTM